MDHTSTLTGLQRALNGSRTSGGLDVIFTKLAVDLQNISADNAAEIVQSCLGVMQESTGCDAVCFAAFDEDAASIVEVHSARAGFTSCNPDQLTPLYQNHPVTILPHVLREECLALFQAFFQNPANEYLKGTLLARHTLMQVESR